MRHLLLAPLLLLAACAGAPEPEVTRRAPLDLHTGETFELRQKIDRWADHYEVPRTLVHRVIQRESDYRPRARNGPYWGLMQILPATAQGMGHEGPREALLDPDENMRWGVRYLKGAWMVSDGDEHAAMMWYARGYYYEAKRRCLLRATGLNHRETASHCRGI